MQKFFTLIVALFSFCCAHSQHNINVSQTPAWVDYQEYNPSPNVDEGEITEGVLTLLADYQINIPQEESYFRLITKITDNVGVQSGSNINAVYDPLYQKLVFHAITILRDGKEINKLVPDHFQVIRRELNAENFLYNGALSAMLNMTDVRNGDIIDMSYSIKGFNPIHNGKFADSFILNDYVPIGKVNVSINSKTKLNYKAYNTTLKPEITEKNGYTNYNWVVVTPDRFEYENNIPNWEIVMPTIIVSDYESWEEVVKWATSIYAKNEILASEVKKKINDIDTAYKTQGEKIKAILDFVQNDIRYLGLEQGISSYMPNSSNKVFEQRYGDCKDKSLLLVRMLKEIGVEAYPMLVNTTMRGTILDIPPSPSFFDHCVVKVHTDDNWELYYDPTISNQGGTYKNTHFPNYEHGLVIKESNKTFDTIFSSSDNKTTTLEEYVIKDVNGGATLNVTSTYTDVEADRMRGYFKSNSNSSIVKQYEEYYAKYHPKIKSINHPTVSDNLSKNEFIVSESYIIDSIWRPMERQPEILAIDFFPTSLTDVLYVDNMENRKHNIGLPYPVSREHRTHVVLPNAWDIKKASDFISNDVFYYDLNVDYDKKRNEVQIKSYLKIQKPSIKTDEFKSYTDDLTLLDKTFGYTVFIPKNNQGIQGQNSFFGLSNIILALFAVGLIACVVIFSIWLFSRKKKAI